MNRSWLFCYNYNSATYKKSGCPKSREWEPNLWVNVWKKCQGSAPRGNMSLDLKEDEQLSSWGWSGVRVGRRMNLTKSHINSKVSVKPSVSNPLSTSARKYTSSRHTTIFQTQNSLSSHTQKIPQVNNNYL